MGSEIQAYITIIILQTLCMRKGCKSEGPGKWGHIFADTLLPTQMFPRLPGTWETNIPFSFWQMREENKRVPQCCLLPCRKRRKIIFILAGFKFTGFKFARFCQGFSNKRQEPLNAKKEKLTFLLLSSVSLSSPAISFSRFCTQEKECHFDI